MKKFINVLLISFILLSFIAVTGVHADSGAPFSVSGQVIDRYGNPLPGADVTLVDNNYDVLDHKTTNDNGEYDFVSEYADTGTFTLMVSYKDSTGTVHKTPSYYIKWFDTKGIVTIPKEQTIIPDYPPPTYGYVYGAIQTDTSSTGVFTSGIVYLVSMDNQEKYYEIAAETDGKGSFQFYAPPGTYMLYAQHWDGSVVYQSQPQQITIGRNSDVREVSETRIILPLITPSTNADPSVMPVQQSNKVNGTVVSKDNVGVKGATVTLLERSDNGMSFVPMKDSNMNNLTRVTDDNGYYEFDGVAPTTDDGKPVQTKKDIKVQVSYTDQNGSPGTITSNDIRPLYYPNVILSYGAEIAARSIAMPAVTVPYAQDGWVKLQSIPSGAYIYLDGHLMNGQDQKPLLTPNTTYIAPGPHEIKMTKPGYQDAKGTITMTANAETQFDPMELQKPLIPEWVQVVVAVIILLIVVVLLIALMATRIRGMAASLKRMGGGVGNKIGDMKANREIAKAHSAEAAEQKRADSQRKPEETAAPRREPARAARPDAMQGAPRGDDVHEVYVDPMKRKQEAGASDSRKKVLDIDLKHIADSVPKKMRTKDAIEAQKERTPVVFANDIYKKPAAGIERIPYDTPAKSYEPVTRYEPPVKSYEPVTRYEPPMTRPKPVDEREALVERPMMPERNERFRIPRMSGPRDAGSSLGDKERVLRYIRDHQEGVSFIQMSNDLEIIPNNLTYITKELVINDDIEKVRGLYYYKSHASPSDEKSSSVVVWKLDSDK